MPRKAKTYQFDLLANLQGAGETPQWLTLPTEARLALTKLLARLILNHARAPEREEARDDA